MANEDFKKDASALKRAFDEGNVEPLRFFAKQFSAALTQYKTERSGHEQVYPELMVLGKLLNIGLPEPSGDRSAQDISGNFLKQFRYGKYATELPVYMAWLAINAPQLSGEVYRFAGLTPRRWEGDPPGSFDIEMRLKNPSGTHTQYTLDAGGLLYRIHELVPAMLKGEFSARTKNWTIAGAAAIAFVVSVVFATSLISSSEIKGEINQNIEAAKVDYLIENVSQLAPVFQREQLEYTAENNLPGRFQEASKIKTELSLAYLLTDPQTSQAHAFDASSTDADNLLALVLQALVGDEVTANRAKLEIRSLAHSQDHHDAKVLMESVYWLSDETKDYPSMGGTIEDYLDAIWSDIRRIRDKRVFEVVAFQEALLGVDSHSAYFANRFIEYTGNCTRLISNAFLTGCQVLALKANRADELSEEEYFDAFAALIVQAALRGETSFENALKLALADEAVSRRDAVGELALNHLVEACDYGENIWEWQRAALLLAYCSDISKRVNTDFSADRVLQYQRKALAKLPSLDLALEFLDSSFLHSYFAFEVFFGDPISAYDTYRTLELSGFAQTDEGQEKIRVFDVYEFDLVEAAYSNEVENFLSEESKSELEDRKSLEELTRLAIRRLESNSWRNLDRTKHIGFILDAMLLTAVTGQQEKARQFQDMLVAAYVADSETCWHCDHPYPYDVALFHSFILRLSEFDNQINWDAHGLRIITHDNEQYKTLVQSRDGLSALAQSYIDLLTYYDPDATIMEQQLVRYYRGENVEPGTNKTLPTENGDRISMLGTVSH